MSAPTPHNAAQPGDIAERILLPGDPLRAKVIAEAFFTDAVCFNQVRNMLGYTGTYKGERVSVMGTGMGVPSISIYATELFRFYGVTTAIRVGSCGALREEIALRDVVIAMTAHTNSSHNQRRFGGGIDFCPTADYGLLSTAHRIATERGLRAHVGAIMSSDSFYDDDVDRYAKLVDHGTLAVEMECSALYTIAAGHGGKALCLATVSDHLVHHGVLTAEERQTGFMEMAELALETLIA